MKPSQRARLVLATYIQWLTEDTVLAIAEVIARAEVAEREGRR